MPLRRKGHPQDLRPAALGLVYLVATCLACTGSEPAPVAQTAPSRPAGDQLSLEVRQIDGSVEQIVIPRHARRIVSQSEASDDILLALVDPERLVAISSRSRTNSSQPTKAERVGTYVENSVEQILGLRPDLVVTAAYSSPELVSHLDRAGVAQLQIQRFSGWADIRANILLLGRAVDAQDDAEQLVDDLERRLQLARQSAQSRPGPKPRVLAYTYGNAQARGTTFDDVIHHCDGTNVAGELEGWAAVDIEQVAAWDPDIVFLSGDASVDGESGAPLLEHPVLAHTRLIEPGRVAVIPGTLFGTVSQRHVDLVERVCETLDRMAPVSEPGR